MIYFLTSSPCVAGSPALNPVNGFVDELRKALPGPCRALFICSDPDQPSLTYGFAEDMRESFGSIGIPFTDVQVLERNNQDRCGELAAGAGLIFLVGGHVPTQNAFFQDIALRERLAGWDGVIVGVSAGSMNAADLVYAQPEEPGEAVDPDYQRWLTGLGLTKRMTTTRTRTGPWMGCASMRTSPIPTAWATNFTSWWTAAISWAGTAGRSCGARRISLKTARSGRSAGRVTCYSCKTQGRVCVK